MTKTTILKNISWQTGYQIFSSILGVIFNIILARKISQFEFGAFSYIFSLLAIVGLFLELGVPIHFLRKWSTDISEIKNDFMEFLFARFLISVPISALLFIYVFFIDRFVSLEFLLAYIYTLIDIFVQPSRIFFTSQNKFEKIFLIDGMERTVSLIGGSFLLLSGFSIRMVLLTFIVGRLGSLLVSIYLNRSNHTLSFDMKKTWLLLKFTLPLFVVSVFSTLYFRIDMIVIRYLLGVEPVGYYSAAYRLLDTSALLPSIITTAAIPTIIALFVQNQKDTLHKLFNTMVQTLTIVSIHVAICGFLYARPVIELIYGSKFENSVPLLQILGINAVFLFITYPLSHFLMANHQEKYYIKVLLTLVLLNIGLNLVLVPRLGVVGAAFTTIITEAVSVILLMRKNPIKIEFSPLVKIVLAAFIGWLSVALSPFTWYINVLLQSIVYFAVVLSLQIVDIREFLPAKR